MQIGRSQRSRRPANRWSCAFHERSRLILLLSATYLIVFLFVLGVSVFWTRDDYVDSVRVLGSGSRLSLLVTSGPARLLIASGDDASAFAGALGDALHPTSRRIDVVVVAGGDGDLPVASRAIRDHSEGSTFVIDGPLASRLSELGLQSEQVIAKPIRIRLSASVNVTVRPSIERDGGWSAVIVGDDTTVTAASSVSAVAGLEATAVIITDDYDATMTTSTVGALIVPTRAASWQELRDAAAVLDRPLWAVRLAPATSVRLTITGRGLRLPSSARALNDGAGASPTGSRPAVWSATPRTPA